MISETLAAALASYWQHHPTRGVLICNSIPEASALPQSRVDEWLHAALHQAHKQDIKGKALTPFLLQRLAVESDGATVDAILSLIKNNARVAAEIAVAYGQLGVVRPRFLHHNQK